jgi:hypothetical protein
MIVHGLGQCGSDFLTDRPHIDGKTKAGMAYRLLERSQPH